MALEVRQFPCLSDNYAFLVRDEASGSTACIDTPEVGPILTALAEWGGRLDMILNTHWNADHAGGNAAANAATGAINVAPAEVTKNSAIDRVVEHGDWVELGQTRFEVIVAGGHTLGHIGYHDAAD